MNSNRAVLIVTLVQLLSLTWIQHNVGMQYLDQVAVSIDPVQLNDFLLNTNPNDTKTLFGEYSQYLLHFDWTNGSDINTSLSIMRDVFNATSQYNQRRVNTGNPIRLWLSINPGIYIRSEVSQVVAIINKVNSEFEGTVLSLLLHYPSMRISDEGAKLIHHNIQIATEVIRTNATTFNILLGVIMDVANCQGTRTYFKSMNLHQLDMLVFLPYDLPAQQLTSELQSYVFWTCYQKLESAIGGFRHVVFHVNSPIQINRATGSFSQDLTNLNLFRNVIYKNPRLKNWFHFIVEAHYNKNNSNSVEENANFSVLDNHGTPNKILSGRPFNKKYLGFSVYTQYINLNSTLLIPHIFTNFRKVLIEPRKFGHVTGQSLVNFVKEIATYKMNLGSKVKKRGEESIFDDGIAPEIFLVVNALQKEADRKTWKLIDALLAMKSGNKISPDIIKGVLINYENCHNCVVEDLNSSSKNQSLISGKLNNLQANMFLEPKLRIGVILDIHDCFKLSTGHPSSVLHDKHIFIVKINITMNNLEQGSPFIIPLFKRCKSILESFYLQWHLTLKGVIFGLYVKVYGCSSVNTTEILTFVTFLETMNVWAIQDKTQVYIDTAFKDTKLYSNGSSQCFKGQDLRYTEPCDCGWWRVAPNSANLANNGTYFAEDKKTFLRRLTEPKGVTPETKNPIILLWIAIAVLIFVVIASIGVSYLAVHYRKKYLLSKREVTVFFKGSPSNENPINELNMDGSGKAQSQPYNKEFYELGKSKFKIDTSKSLGSGEFGIVCHGTITRNSGEICVAVKTTKKQEIENSHSEYLCLRSLICEIKILSFVGSHKHILRLEGAYTAKLKKGKVFVFLELCECGSLETYLRQCEATGCKDEDEMSTGNKLKNTGYGALNAELSNDLSRWAGEIACGMEYLASKNLVHADLGTRNILLNSLKKVKISDFGLARRLYEYESYLKEQQEPLPWRWMAPESLRKMMFNEKTDVWMFGVTLWEMYTLGDLPYPELSWQVNFPAMLERGLRLAQPKFNEKDMFSVMKSCWDIAPGCRPAFSELKLILAKCCVGSVNETSL